MNNVVSVKLEWHYSPDSFLEESLTVNFAGVTVNIENGVATATLKPTEFDKNSSLLDELTQTIENRLKAVQLTEHKSYQLSRPSRIETRDDGSENQIIEVPSVKIEMETGTPDVIVRDTAGRVVTDTRQDRLDRQQRTSDLLDKYRSGYQTLELMLQSYEKSVVDPNNELVHLYEIRDALSEEFQNGHFAQRTLGLTDRDWRELGRLANGSPLRQGRHRGNNAGSLRDATSDELARARSISAGFIEKYLEYLDNQQGQTP